MEAAGTPGFFPKTALVTSKLIYKPFLIPQKLTDSSTLVGHELNGMVAGVTASIGTAYDNLQPRGPAKWLSGLFHKVNEATVHSEAVAQRNKAVFWDPFSQGSEAIGRAFAGPGTYWYLRKAGIEQPTADNIHGALSTKLFHFPTAEEVPTLPGVPGAGGAAPAAAAAEAASTDGAATVEASSTPAATPVPVEAAAQAADGAGQLAA